MVKLNIEQEGPKSLRAKARELRAADDLSSGVPAYKNEGYNISPSRLPAGEEEVSISSLLSEIENDTSPAGDTISSQDLRELPNEQRPAPKGSPSRFLEGEGFKGTTRRIGDYVAEPTFTRQGEGEFQVDVPRSRAERFEAFNTEVARTRRPDFNEIQNAIANSPRKDANSGGLPAFYENVTDLLDIAARTQDPLILTALNDLGYNPNLTGDNILDDQTVSKNKRSAAAYATSLLSQIAQDSAKIDITRQNIQQDFKKGDITEQERTAKLVALEEPESISPSTVGDTLIKESQRLLGATSVSSQATEQYGVTEGLPAGSIDPTASAYLASTILGSLPQWFNIDVETADTKGRDGKITPSRASGITDGLKNLFIDNPELTTLLSKGLRRDVLYDLPARSGIRPGDAGVRQRLSSKTQADEKVHQVTSFEEALDYYGTRPWSVANKAVAPFISILSTVINNSPKDSQGRNFLLSGGLPAAKSQGKAGNILISRHPLAAAFEMDYASLAKILNKHNWKKVVNEAGYEEQVKILNVIFTNDPVEPGDTNYQNVTEFLRDLDVNSQKAAAKSQATGDVSDHAWVFLTAIPAFNVNVKSNINQTMELLEPGNRSVYFPMTTIGTNGRAMIDSNTLNVQTSPIQRGFFYNGETKIIYPKPNADGRLAQRTHKFKQLMTHVLELEHPYRQAEFKALKKKGVAVGKYKPELETSREIQEETFDLHFSRDPKLVERIRQKNNRLLGGEVISKEDIQNIQKKGQDYIDASHLLNNRKSDGTRSDIAISRDALKANFNKANSIPGNRSDSGINSFGDSNLQIDQYNLKDAYTIANALEWHSKPTVDAQGTVTEQGTSKGRSKEGTTHLNALINLSDFVNGTPFPSTLHGEKDGSNNNFAWLGLLTHDSGANNVNDNPLLKFSGIINPDLVSSLKPRYTKEGDKLPPSIIMQSGNMRNNAASKSVDYWQQASDGQLKVEGPAWGTKKNLDIFKAIASDQKATDIFWKPIIMTAGYGKSFKSFKQQASTSMTSEPAIIAALSKHGLDPVSSGKSAGFALAATLGYSMQELSTFTEVMAEAGNYAADHNQEAEFYSKAARKLNMSPEAFLHEIVGKAGSATHRLDLITPSLDKVSKASPATQKYTKTHDPKSFTRLSDPRKASDPGQEKGSSLREYEGRKLERIGTRQGKRLSPLFIHGYDASAIVNLGVWAGRSNKGRSNETAVNIFPIFDAIGGLDVDSFNEVEAQYNKALVDTVRDSNYYEEAFSIIKNTDTKAIKSGDARSYAGYLNDASAYALSLEDSKSLAIIEENYKYLNELTDTYQVAQEDFRKASTTYVNESNRLKTDNEFGSARQNAPELKRLYDNYNDAKHKLGAATDNYKVSSSRAKAAVELFYALNAEVDNKKNDLSEDQLSLALEANTLPGLVRRFKMNIEKTRESMKDLNESLDETADLIKGLTDEGVTPNNGTFNIPLAFLKN